MEYAVHVYHINVDVGDCAIYLLLESGHKKSFFDPPNKDYLIVSAVFLDGGEDRLYGRQNIKDVIKRIEQAYTISPAADGRLKFDSVIVSHWDSDHYKGVARLLRESITEAAGTTIQVSPSVPGKKDPGKTAPKKKKILSPLLWYDMNETPLSTIYAPYWTSISQFNTVSSRKELQVVYYVKTKKQIAEGVANIVAGTENVLGLDFFKRPQIGGPKYTGAKSSVDLLALHKADRPGLYCIAANSTVLGEPTGPSSADTSFIVKPTTTTPTNKSSIVTMVIWPSVIGPHQICHYSPGRCDS
jgi:hypothetical protein